MSAPLADGAGRVQVRTHNFLVTAPDQNTAQQFGQLAEHYRKQKAVEWLGQEMPNWPRPCPLTVKPTMGGAGGATSSTSTSAATTKCCRWRSRASTRSCSTRVLPHEVTHTVFAHHFRHPVPRWADEGGSVLSEDDAERQHHDKLVRNTSTTARAFSSAGCSP